MAAPKVPLEPEKFYHIYNRGINGCTVYHEETNYNYFLGLYEKHISPIADTYAWALLVNHFHLLVKILNPEGLISNPEGFENLQGFNDNINKHVSQQFSNLFNAYTKAFNIKYNRTGSLFEHTFKRKCITNETYLKQLVVYIHTNPVHHGITMNIADYLWTSYSSIVSSKPTKIKRDCIIGWFDNRDNFIEVHKQKVDSELIKDFIIEA
jgi:putative transposase